ncbi:hypothetical protein [Polaromonas sp.]|uniref:type IV pilus assembly protein FimV n=1 Tax=Polaromonas sp. TaxID=1869339 RepID=UPI0017ED3D30|nr:hypothetical protein [Polaromonas sp.]NMM05062.1 hypothetical protein [Polaromonas sp.]
MNATETTLKYILGAVLLGATGCSLAVSLGRMQGATLVGRPFDVTLTAQLDSAEGLSGVCVAADVFFGDAQVPENRVRILTSAGAKAGDARIRIQTTSMVDEPVVTVYVREGCSQKNARKYVILAEFLSDSASPVPVTMGEAITSAAAAVQRPGMGEAGSVAGALASTKRAESATSGTRKPAFRPKVVASPATAADERPAGATTPQLILPSTRMTARVAAEPARKSSRARLKLDVLDLAAERDPVLRSTSELLTMPSTNALQRATAIALWQALNAQPQDILRDTQRLKSLETDVASMLVQSRKTEAAVTQLRVELEQARSERYSNWLVYGLGVLLMLASVLGIFLWTQSRRQISEFSRGPWWRRRLDTQEDMEIPGPEPYGGESMSQHLSTHPGRATGPTVAAPDVDFEADEFPHARPKISQDLQLAGRLEPMDTKSNTGFSSSLPGAPRLVNAEELSDVQHQADFFMSLGQFDKALDVLHHHITESEETSALVYLDLLDLYHHLNRKVDYELLRKDFNEIFNAQVSAFEQYSPESNGLEFYPSALSRIESLWPTPRVLDVIEETIFRKPGSNGDVFDIAAYRELLLLYAIAKEIVEQPAEVTEPAGSSSPSDSGFSSTSSQPLSARLKDMPELSSLSKHETDLTRFTASRWLALDIDVSRDFDDSPASQCVEIGELLEFDIDPSYLHGVKDK